MNHYITTPQVSKIIDQLYDALAKNLLKKVEVVTPKYDYASYILVTFNPRTPTETIISLMTHIESKYDLVVGLTSNKDAYTELITGPIEERYMTIQTPKIIDRRPV